MPDSPQVTAVKRYVHQARELILNEDEELRTVYPEHYIPLIVAIAQMLQQEDVKKELKNSGTKQTINF